MSLCSGPRGEWVLQNETTSTEMDPATFSRRLCVVNVEFFSASPLVLEHLKLGIEEEPSFFIVIPVVLFMED